jgi:hypothetical protein
MRRTLIVVLCLSLALIALTGCKAKELADKAAISKDLDKRGTTDLMKEISNDSYTPPEDGRLTDAQVQMYLKVREQEKKIALVAKEEMQKHADKVKEKGDKSLAGMVQGLQALGSAADFVTADLRAAKDLGYNSQEYIWVKSQILAASTSAMAEQVGQVMSANFDKAYQDAKKAYDEAPDDQTKKLYADVLAGYDKNKQEMQNASQNVDPATAYNRQLLSKYEGALNAYAQELSKWENKPGEVQKSMDEFAKQVEAAKKQ